MRRVRGVLEADGARVAPRKGERRLLVHTEAPRPDRGRAVGRRAVPSMRMHARKPAGAGRRRGIVPFATYRVEVVHEGDTVTIDVDENDYILDAAVEAGLEVPHDCKMGVCMMCPAKLVEGTVDQTEGMLSDDVADKGYVLLCVGKPTSDCSVRTVSVRTLARDATLSRLVSSVSRG